MIKHALGIALLASSCLGSAAQAADLTVAEEVIVATPVFNWTGFYAGVHAGYGWADLDTDYTDLLGGGNKPDGFFGGGQVGYNYQFENNVVLGVEADASFGDLKDDASRHFTVPFAADASIENKIESLGTVRARLGYAADRFLPYVTGGFAWANVKSGLTVDVPGLSDGPVSYDDSQTFTGWTVGAGLEYAVTSNITAKVEYLYADLGSKDFGLGGDIVPADLSSLQTAKFGVNYKF